MQQTAVDQVFEALKVGPIQVDELGTALGVSGDLVRLDIRRLRQRGVVIQSLGQKRWQLGEGAPATAPARAVAAELPEDAKPELTDDEIAARLNERFNALTRMVAGVIRGILPAIIVSGPPGLGKSHGVKSALAASKVDVRKPKPGGYDGDDGEADADMYDDGVCDQEGQFCDYVSGSITAVGLYIALWNVRRGGILVLDDCDQVFKDEEAMNILKAALDSSDVRTISWRKQSSWLADLGIQPTFDFKGRVVFLTNIDFEAASNRPGPMGAHCAALLDRSLYLSLTIRSKRDVIVRIKQVAPAILPFDQEVVDEVLDFVVEHRDQFYSLSLRLVHQIGICRQADPENWRSDVAMTKMRVG